MVYVILIGLFLAITIIALIRVISRKARDKKAKEKAENLIDRLSSPASSLLGFYNSLSNKYITNTDSELFRHNSNDIYNELHEYYIHNKYPLNDILNDLYTKIENLEANNSELNRKYIQTKIQEHNDFLSNIDGKSLDFQQREVVVSEEDRTLVLAGAGSGKTLTIGAKVKYLCNIQGLKPENILVLSFTNKSADEMTQRLKQKLDINLEASTFHKLGLDIIKKHSGYRPEVLDNLAEFVHNFFENDLVTKPYLIKALSEYFIYYLEIPENREDYSSIGDLYEMEKAADLETLKSKYEKQKYISESAYEKSQSLHTINGETVKSIEETKIANFLFMNGINYEYEHLYPFESDDPSRKSYRPDFYLVDYDIYIEHFGVSKDFTVPWLSSIEEKKYLDGIKWKRSFHRQNGTILLETYSYYSSEGVLLTKLEEILKANKVDFKPREFTDIFNTVYASKTNKYFSEFVNLCCNFITLFKSSAHSEDYFNHIIQTATLEENDFMRERTKLFITIVHDIYNNYQIFLKKNNAIDYSDMINLAAEYVKNSDSIPDYKYIIVDEYQDISKARFNLIKQILNKSNAKLLCVGDDWQSIYRFAGSDISLFTEFQNHVGYTDILKIEKTYRNSQQLIDEASRFIQKNPFQLKKNLISEKLLDYPLVFWGYNQDPVPTLRQIILKIISEYGPEKSILFLGRNNHDIEILKTSGLFSFSKKNRQESISCNISPSTPVSFLSVHKSKGLEADNVIILNFKNDKLGFPNQIADDVVLKYVLTKDEKFLFAEERRLFYVAITRTKNRTFVLTDNKSPSFFLKDFAPSNKVCFISIDDNKPDENIKCPRCKTGNLLKISSKGTTFVGCSNFPNCTYTVNNISILVNTMKCPACGGFLIKRKGQHKHWFLGCTNYPYCDYTEEIIKKKNLFHILLVF